MQETSYPLQHRKVDVKIYWDDPYEENNYKTKIHGHTFSYDRIEEPHAYDSGKCGQSIYVPAKNYRNSLREDIPQYPASDSRDHSDKNKLHKSIILIDRLYPRVDGKKAKTYGIEHNEYPPEIKEPGHYKYE